MLRLRPTVISLTLQEVKEMEERRLEERHLSLPERLRGKQSLQAIAVPIDSSTSRAVSQASAEKWERPSWSVSDRGPLASSSNQASVQLQGGDEIRIATRPLEPGTPYLQSPGGERSAGTVPLRLFTFTPRRVPRDMRIESARAAVSSASPTLSDPAASQTNPDQHHSPVVHGGARTEPRVRGGPSRPVRGDDDSAHTDSVRLHVESPAARLSHRIAARSTARTDAESSRGSRGGAWIREQDGGDRPLTPPRRSSLNAHHDIGMPVSSVSPAASQAARHRSDMPRHRLTPSQQHARVGPEFAASNAHGSTPRRNRQGNLPSHLGQTQTVQISHDLDEPEVRNFQVYDDDLPASLQPQTPQHLPEARHRSRLSGTYTAATGQASPLQVRARTTSRRRQERHPRRRSPSPRGLQAPGFAGLYGGRENTDDALLFEHAEIARGLESGDGDG